MLPENLVLVRHGESEFNKLVHELRKTNRDFNTLDPSVLSELPHPRGMGFSRFPL